MSGHHPNVRWINAFFMLSFLALPISVSRLMAETQAGTPTSMTLTLNEERPLVDEDGRLWQAPARIDVAKTPAGPVRPLAVGDWTLAVWYFGAWEPEYQGWGDLARYAPWRIPLLYDSRDARTCHNGIQFYSNSNPRVMDWHVKWMAENGVNLVMWDWYPSRSKERFDTDQWVNRPLEVGFLGKDKVGGKPVQSNRFAGQIDFAVMWTNHFGNYVPQGTMEYVCDNFFNQPNYYKMDGRRPLVIIHSLGDLFDEHASGEGRDQKLKQYLDGQRAIARQRGYDIYIALGQIEGRVYLPWIKTLGFDGVMNYVIHSRPGFQRETRIVRNDPSGQHAKASPEPFIEADFERESIPSHLLTWRDLTDFFGRDHLLTVTTREDFRPWPELAGRHYIAHATPEKYRRLLGAAKQMIGDTQGRHFITVGIWNEWFEGNTIEPDCLYGYEWLKAIREEFQAKGK